MKKILVIIAAVFTFALNVFAQEYDNDDTVFLTLTKYEEKIEKLPANVTVITREEIENKRVQNLGELLQNQAGINVRINGSIGAVTSVSIRGASSLQTLLLIDGRRANDIGLGSADFTALPVTIIERVEIIRGAGAAVYGTSAFGGVVNVITKKAKDDSPLADAGYSYGSFNTWNPYLTGAYGSEKAGILASGYYISSSGDRENSRFEGGNKFLSLQANPFKNSKIFMTGNIWESRYGVPGSTYYLTPENEQKDDNKYLKLDYDLNIDESMTINASAYAVKNIRNFYDYNGGNPYDPTWTLNDGFYKYTSETYGAQTDFHYKELLLVGGEFWEDFYKENEALSGFSSDKSRTNLAAYTQLNLALGNLSVIPTVRYDNNSQFGDVVTPAISAVFNLNDSVKFSANSGKVWRAPVFTELYWYQPSYGMFGDPDLKPESGISSDIGAEYVKNKIKLSGNVFYIDSEDLIAWDFDPVTFEYHVKNIGKAQQYGFEFSAGYIMYSWLTHTINYTYLKTENKQTDKELPYKPQSTINYSLTVKPIENLSVSGILSYQDKVFTNAANTDELDGFVTLDVNVNYEATKNISFWVRGVNVGNAKYELSAGYPMSGAAVYGGIEFKFWK
ncbi:MAG: TonB-dependent receptor [Endomicrobia bacterium]|nr:TonB-dependent receptor [Endomicrobiia bacterium]